MTRGKQAFTPMTRGDWAWILTCVICGTLAALLGLAIESSEEEHRQTYGHALSFETKGDSRIIIDAVRAAAPDSHLVPYSTHPPYNFFADWFAGMLGVLMASCFFRILEKICGRLLGLSRREGFGLGTRDEETITHRRS